MCLAFFFVLRRSEIAATTSTTFWWFALTAADIAVIDAEGTATADPKKASAVCIRLRGSKTNRNGPPITRILSRSGHPHSCPVLGALLLFRARGNSPPEILAAVLVDKGERPRCVTAARVAKENQDAAGRMGKNPRQYSTDSLRAGGATNMYRAGVDSRTIQLHGRWTSGAFKLYTRLCNDSVAAVVTDMVSGAANLATLQ